MRVVSLVPSVTETLLAWGIEPVACTRFCEQPGLPHVGGTKDPDIDAVVGWAPDLVVANDEENRREDADALAAAGLDVHVVVVRTIGDVAPALASLAARLGVPFEPWVLPESQPVVRRAFVPIWRRPWMTLNADTYGSSLLRLLGIDNVYADALDRYPIVELSDVAARRPDHVLAPTEPYPFAERHAPELATVAPVAFVDGQDLFWWGTRTPAALARIRGHLASALA